MNITKMARYIRNESPYVIRAREIRLLGVNLPACFCMDLFRRLPYLIPVSGANCDVGPFQCQFPGHSPSQALASAGNNRNPIFQPQIHLLVVYE